MSFFRTDDPLADFARHNARQEAWLARQPVCVHCGHHIQEENLVDINGELYHEQCAHDEFRKRTEDYIE